MTIVWKYLLERGPEGVSTDQLENLIQPVSLKRKVRDSEDEEEPGSDSREKKSIYDGVLTEIQNLRIVEKDDNEMLTLSKNAPKKDALSLVEYLERVLLDPELAEEHGQKAFPQAMSWLLTRDPFQPLAFRGGFRAEVTRDYGDDVGSFELTNQARSQQFIHWAIYLGFAWRLSAGTQDAVFPDPTEALKRNLPLVMPSGSQLSIQEVVENLAARVPVFEGGRAREEIEGLLPPDKTRSDRTLSRSTSIALERLEQSGSIKMERPADAPAWNLDRATGTRPVSHITWLGGK
jgi:hypothetical protein